MRDALRVSLQSFSVAAKRAKRTRTGPAKDGRGLGDLLFAAVNLSRFLKIDPEIALKKANAKFLRRFRGMERLARKSGREFKDLPREEMEALWDATKQAEENPRFRELDGAQTKP